MLRNAGATAFEVERQVPRVRFIASIVALQEWQVARNSTVVGGVVTLTLICLWIIRRILFETGAA